ncbi:MAG: sugar ABC transporter ATP-binding protein [Phycisphaerales bacterium]
MQDFLVAKNISKRFGITQALDKVSVAFRAGEVHALMGENGAGKSTLGKVIAGLHRQDEGVVELDGRPLTPGAIDEAFGRGIRIVHQELAQCPNLSVAENLTLHDMPAVAGFVKRSEMFDRAAALVHKLDPGIDVAAPLGDLPPGRRQIVQIASALEDRGHAGAPRVIVFDEPTSSLSVAEADRLLEITSGLASRGLTIIYVSHRMGEIFQVCDRVSVLRDGKFVATSVIKDIDEPTLVEQMIGRRIETAKRAEFASAGTAARSEPVLEVRNLSSPGKLRSVRLAVRPGEVVGVGGLVGSGRSELLDAVFGLDLRSTGEVRVGGTLVAQHDPRDRIRRGMGYVPEDRRLQGLFFDMGIDDNIVLPFMHQIAAALGFRSTGNESALVGRKMNEFRVKAASPSSRPGELSGGNQQKLLIARWMDKDTKVLLLDEPTRGIDVGTKAEVYRLIREAAARGTAVLLVSSEMPELLALADRVLVMCEGTMTGELAGDELSQANILKLATLHSRGATVVA